MRESSTIQRPVYRAMLSAALIASAMIDDALRGSVPLLFRGCLAAGGMSIEGDFFIGPAVDEAAEHFDLSDGPFFWMAPSALALNEKYAVTFHDRIEPAIMIRYSVPMKDGMSRPTLVHCHAGLTRPAARWLQTRQRVFSAFGSTDLRADVEQKGGTLWRCWIT